MTHIKPFTPFSGTETAQSQLSAFHPPIAHKKPWKPTTKPITTIDEFQAVCAAAEDKLARYVASPRANYARLAPDVARNMDPRRARYLNANNITARIDIAKLVLDHLHDNAGIADGPLQFITVVPREYVVSVDEAVAMSPDDLHELIYRLQQLTRQTLQGIPFIGMVEPGLFKGWGPSGPQPYKDSISWHVHAITWGFDRKSVRIATKRIGRGHKSISGGSPVHVKTIHYDELDVHGLYLVKAPLKEYQLNAKVGDDYDTETGEIFVKYRQQKRDMGTGDRVRVANASRHLNLDDLLFGAGAGKLMANGIKAEALRIFHAEETRADVHRIMAHDQRERAKRYLLMAQSGIEA